MAINPRVNLNGTSRAALIEQATAVIEAATALEKALAEASPHGRDYQTYPDNAAFKAASETNAGFIAQVYAIAKEYERLGEELIEGAP